MEGTRTATAVMDADLTLSPISDDYIEELAAEISEEITRVCHGRVHKLNVQITPRRVALTGYCATFHCNQLAQTAAMSLAEGRAVDNQIVVW